MSARWWAVALVALAMIGVPACSSGAKKVVPTSVCPTDALAKAVGPVTIRFWHAQTDKDLDRLKQLKDKFEQSQSKVKVELVQFPTSADLFAKYQAGLTSGDFPDVAQFDDTATQSLVDSKSMLPAAACVKADAFDTSDFVERTLAYYTVRNQLQGFAWPASSPVLVYDKNVFAKSGLDPNTPPKTLDEVREFSQKIKASGAAPYGIALPLQPYLNEFFTARADQEYVNNGNGRTSRATRSQLDNATGRQIWQWWKQMKDDGLLFATGAQAGNPDHILAVGSGVAAMSIDVSSALAPLYDALGAGLYPNLALAGGPVPGLVAGGAVPAGGSALWISKRSSAEKIAASWAWEKFLVSADTQVVWTTESGSVPTRKSAAAAPPVQALWQAKPIYKVAYEQLNAGDVRNANAGSLIGPYQEVRDAVHDGLSAMLAGSASSADAIKQAQATADQSIAAYNRSVKG